MQNRRPAPAPNRNAKPTRRAPKRRKQRKERPALRVFFTVCFTFIAIAVICASVAGSYVYKFANEYVENNDQPIIDLDVYKANQAQTSIIYAYDSNKQQVELLRLHGTENRVWIEYDDIPRVCRLLYATSFLSLIIFSAVKCFIVF